MNSLPQMSVEFNRISLVALIDRAKRPAYVVRDP